MLTLIKTKVKNLFNTFKFNFDFLLLFLILLISNWQYLSKAFFPIHDTLEVFTFFHYFYSEWVTQGEIPQWFPYVTYGVPTNFYQLRNITPVYYVFMLIGKLFSIKDVIFLFKVSVIAEQCIFLTGMYKLSRYLFKQRSTVFIVCLSAIGGIIWHSAINFNFRLYAMFPLVIYLLLLFFEKQKDGFLWFAGIVCLVGGMGVTIYFLGLWAFVYSVFVLVLLFCYKNSYKNIFRFSKKNVFFFLGFVLLIVLVLLYLKSSTEFLTLVSKERKTSGVNTIATFLNYGRIPQVKSIFRGLFFANADIGVGVPYDNTIYMGLIPLFFLFWSFFNVRKTQYYLFLGMAVMLIWLSFGGIFASLMYHFPVFAYYRHIGHVYSLVKILLIICAGYGVEHFFQSSFKRKIGGIFYVIVFVLILFDIFINSNHELVSPELGLKGFFSLWSFMKFSYLNPLFQGFLKYLVLSAFCVFCGIVWKGRKHFRWHLMETILKGFVVILIFLDLFMFQQTVNGTIPKIPETHYSWLESAKVRVSDYQAERGLDPITQEQKDAYHLVMLSDPTAKYVSAYNFVQFDRCDPGFRVDLATQGVLELISVPDLKRALVGCYYPKMRLVPHAIFSKDPVDLMKIVQNYESFSRVVVLDPKGGDRQIVFGDKELDPRNKVEVTFFSPDKVEAQVNVYNEQGGWLIYDDAFHPNWKAFVDAKEVTVQKAYWAFKAIFLEKGQHKVVFQYKGFGKIRSIIVAFLGLTFGLILMSVFIGEFFRKDSSREGLFANNHK